MVDLIITPDNREQVRGLRPALTRQSRVLLTGATGMIGGEIAKVLDVFGVGALWCLVRSREGQTPATRLEGRMRKSGYNPAHAHALSGDVTLSDLGLERETSEMLREEVDIIIHCAAETSFIQADSCERVNVEGTKNILAFARSCRKVPLIVFVSTACNGGKNNHASLSEDSGCRPDRSHHNGYTLSKAHSESMVRSSGLPFLVVRPTIVMSTGVSDSIFARQILWFAPLVREFTHLPLDPGSKVDITCKE